MADYDQQGRRLDAADGSAMTPPPGQTGRGGRPAGPGSREDGARAWCQLIYALHALSLVIGVFGAASIVGAFLVGWPSIIAVIINYLKQGEVADTWLASHFRWQIRTFWFAALWVLLAIVLALSIIGLLPAFLILGALSIWLIYRIVRGWLALNARQPI